MKTEEKVAIALREGEALLEHYKHCVQADTHAQALFTIKGEPQHVAVAETMEHEDKLRLEGARDMFETLRRNLR